MGYCGCPSAMHFGISFLGEAVSERKAAAYQGWHYNWAQPSLTDHNGAEEVAYSCISFDAAAEQLQITQCKSQSSDIIQK